MKNPIYTITHTILVILLLGTSAKTNAQKTINFEIDDFNEVIELKGEKLHLEDPLMNPLEIIISDTLMFLKNDKANPAVDVISLNSGKIISQFCKRGRGPGELVSPFCIQYIENEKRILVQDIIGRKIVFFDLDMILANAPKKYTRSITFKNETWVRKVMELEGGNLFCNLIGHKDGYMNCLLTRDGELIKFLDTYPEIDFPFNPEEGSNIFGSRLAISSDRNRVIMPYLHSDRISIYNAAGDKTIEFQGPDYKDLDLIFKNGRTAITNKNACTYNLPSSNSESFMIPYDGTRYKFAHSPAYHIFHFGFDGSLLQHFKLDHSVTNIAVDWENNIIYGINKDLEPCIYKFNF
ncbi:6-bladed beta-propeller [Draconibacterium sediminis]|uniref:6-bladed beta-propeller n=1 Tax=Draconibacterium sediminis TaxID=1544798 RepID=UPI0026EAA2B1|nr:6-bladed beta-propeller [Draconibacterium sediminis]